jgi:AraC-like DNA-binding protein
MICNAGPRDRVFEEQHSRASVAIVTQGTFQYRSSGGRELMTPGSLLLGNPGQAFECGHEHGVGDRCISLHFEPEYFEELVEECGPRLRRPWFAALRVPPVKETSRVIARACALNASHCETFSDEWEEIAVELAARALEMASDGKQYPTQSLAAEARVTRVVRMMENCPEQEHTLISLAREAGLSRYHFLRVFQQLTGVTPHQYLRRARLRRAAIRLLRDRAQVLEIAIDSGFGDLSNFNHAFRSEFGRTPGEYRKRNGK